MNDLISFSYENQPVRTVTINGEPWFVAMDVCRVLGVSNGRDAVASLDDDEKGVGSIDTLGGTQKLSIVNESGLYALIMRSRKPEAKPFRRWVTSEVLPSIRKTGSYGTPGLPTSFAEALLLAAKLEAERERAVAELEAAQPKVAGYDEFLSADGDFDVRSAAQVLARSGIKTGQTRLFTWLEVNGWIDGDHHPYQTRVNAGHLVRRIQTWTDSKGAARTSVQVRITPKGLDLIRTRMVQKDQK